MWNIDLPPAYYIDSKVCSEVDGHTFDGLVREIRDTAVVAIDTETTGLNKMKDLPLFWSLSWRNRQDVPQRVCMPSHTLYAFRESFEDLDKQWVFANAKYDCHILKNVGINVRGDMLDTIVMHSLLYEDLDHDLKSMARQVLGYGWSDFKDTFKFNKKGKLTENSEAAEVLAGGQFPTVQDAIMWCYRHDLSRLTEYAANDAWGTLQLYEKLFSELRLAKTHSCMHPYEPAWIREEYQDLADVYFKIELPFTRVLYDCECAGVMIDAAYLQSLEPILTQEMDQIDREITRISNANGFPITNVNSNKQLIQYFFEMKRYKPLKYTDGGKSGIKSPSVDDATMQYLIDKYGDQVAEHLRERGDLKKVKGTYVEGMLNRLHTGDRIHTNFNQHIAVTGRLSSSDPNLQNIKRPDEDKEADRFNLRRAFVAPPGHKLVVADYEQLEMRLLAVMSREQDMIDIFLRGWDIHMGNASLIYDIPYDDIKKAKKMPDDEWPKLSSQEADYFRHCLQCRQSAKTVGFGLNYGMQKWTLAKRLKCTPDEAQEKIDAYMRRYPAVSMYFENAKQQTLDTGFAYTMMGRRRYLPDITAPIDWIRHGAERRASNVPIQGTAADIVKLAMIRCANADLVKDFYCQMQLQVHDELMFQVPDEYAEPASKRIRECMEDYGYSVPLLVSMGIADDWSQAK